MVAQSPEIEAHLTIRSLQRRATSAEKEANEAKREAALLRLKIANLQDQARLAVQNGQAASERIEHEHTETERELRRQLETAHGELNNLRQGSASGMETLERQNHELSEALKATSETRQLAEQRFAELEGSLRQQHQGGEELVKIRGELQARIGALTKELEGFSAANSALKVDKERLEAELLKTRAAVKELEVQLAAAKLLAVNRGTPPPGAGAGGGPSWGARADMELIKQRKLNELLRENAYLKQAGDLPYSGAPTPPPLPTTLPSPFMNAPPRMYEQFPQNEAAFGYEPIYDLGERGRTYSGTNLRSSEMHAPYHSSSGHF